MEHDRDSRGGPNTEPLSAAADGVHHTDCHGSSILAPNDSQNWNVDFNLRRYTLATPCPLVQPLPAVEADETSSGTHCPEENLQSSHSVEGTEERENAGTGSSHLTPNAKRKRVVVWHCDAGTVVSAGKWMGESPAAAGGSAADGESPPS